MINNVIYNTIYSFCVLFFIWRTKHFCQWKKKAKIQQKNTWKTKLINQNWMPITIFFFFSFCLFFSICQWTENTPEKKKTKKKPFFFARERNFKCNWIFLFLLVFGNPNQRILENQEKEKSKRTWTQKFISALKFTK